MVRSESCHAIMLVDSGMSEMKSQKLSCADCPVGISLKPLSGLEDQGGQRRLYENLGEGRERRGEASLHCVNQVWEFHAFLGVLERQGIAVDVCERLGKQDLPSWMKLRRDGRQEPSAS